MKTEKLWTKSFILAILVQTGINIGHWNLFSTLGIYTRGLTSLEVYVGVVAGIFTVAALSTRFVSGHLLDNHSHKRILLFGLALSLLANAGYLVASNIPILLAMRVLNGLGYGLASAAIATMISSMIPPDRLVEGLGYSGIVSTLCGAVGPMMALTLCQSDYRLFGRVFWACLLIAALTVGLAMILKSGQAAAKQISKRETTGPAKTPSSATLATGFMFLLVFLIAGVHSAITVCLNLYAIDYDFGDMSLFFTIVAISGLIPRLFVKKVLQVVSERTVLFSSVTALTIVYVGVAAAQQAQTVFFLAILFGLAMGFCYPILLTKTIRTMSETQQGTSNSLYLAAIDFACALGAVFWSGLSGVVGGYRNVYLCAAGVTVVVLLVLFLYPKILKKRRIKEDVWS